MRRKTLRLILENHQDRLLASLFSHFWLERRADAGSTL
jgi:hypothetical protein